MVILFSDLIAAMVAENSPGWIRFSTMNTEISLCNLFYWQSGCRRPLWRR
jgi:hypothetical protein